MIKRNTEPYLSTYLHAKGARLGLPISGNFELTARCNFHCPMCYVHLTNEQVEARGRELTAEEWLSVAEAAKEKGLVFALLTGGEPLVRKDFFEIYRGMKQMGLLLSVNSNGSMLFGENLERFLEDPPVRFNISLYGGCRETYQKMCGADAFDSVVESICQLRAKGVDVGINLSITPYNAADLPKIHALAEDLGVSVRASSYMYPPIRIDRACGGGARLSAEDAARYSVMWDKLRFAPEEFRVRAKNMTLLTERQNSDCPAEQGEGIACRAGRTSFWMTWDGRMLPCGMMEGPAVYPLRDGFDAAWEELRQAAGAIRLPSECGTCAKREVCSVCAAVCYCETGRFDARPDYVCRLTDEQLRLLRSAAEDNDNLTDKEEET